VNSAGEIAHLPKTGSHFSVGLAAIVDQYLNCRLRISCAEFGQDRPDNRLVSLARHCQPQGTEHLFAPALIYGVSLKIVSDWSPGRAMSKTRRIKSPLQT